MDPMLVEPGVGDSYVGTHITTHLLITHAGVDFRILFPTYERLVSRVLLDDPLCFASADFKKLASAL